MIKRIIILSIFFGFGTFSAQHRGDNLSFQGLADRNDFDVKAAAMGGAYTASSGSIGSLFYNPAGLSGIKSLQISVSTNYSKYQWYENQRFRPDRYFLTLPFYLERLYVPDPKDNGKLDTERLWSPDQLLDSSYVVKSPDLGLDPFSEEAADWSRNENNFGFNHFAVAFPFGISEYSFVAAVSYDKKAVIRNYDRNQTYLQPYIGYLNEYGNIGRVNGNDTLIMDWYDYERIRKGGIDEINAALSFDVTKTFKIGVGFNTQWGSSDDIHSLNKIGYFDLIKQNVFRFSYDTTFQQVKGKSDYSASSFNVGFLFELEKFSFGFKIDLPYTFKRKYNYNYFYSDTAGTIKGKLSGTDEISFPAAFNLGARFNPVSNLSLELDYEYSPFGKAEYKLATADSTFKPWVDRETLRFGIDYAPFDFLSVQAGYRSIPAVFVPDGAAIQDAGPNALSYNFGLGIHTQYGDLQFAYQFKKLKYYDSYFSNTNYNTINYTNIMAGYKFNL